MSEASVVQKKRSELVGLVTKCSASKTISIMVNSKVKHPKFKKYETKKQKFLVHDEKGECKVGDTVRVVETRPLSKLKRHRVLEIVKY